MPFYWDEISIGTSIFQSESANLFFCSIFDEYNSKRRSTSITRVNNFDAYQMSNCDKIIGRYLNVRFTYALMNKEERTNNIVVRSL